MNDNIEGTESSESRPSLDAIQKLSKDLRNAAKFLGVREARYFVDTYYQMQDNRIAAANQQRAVTQGEEPSEHIKWLNVQMETLENQIRGMLDRWSAAQPMGEWARSVTGIGPVIAAGLLANIDITKAPTVGHIWRFAGLDPTSKWEKGQKRPWNASLKRLCWLIGESFVKVSGNPNDKYGHFYLKRKQYEIAKNEMGDYREQAREHLERLKKAKPSRKARADSADPNDAAKADQDAKKKLVELLESGKLPPIALHERSKRWAVKLFLAHWHGEAYRLHHGQEPPKPYPIAHLGHVHLIEP